MIPLLTFKLSISPFRLGHRSEEKTFVARFQPHPRALLPGFGVGGKSLWLAFDR